MWLPPNVVDRLKAQRRPGESYSDVILRSRRRIEAAKNLGIVSPSVTEGDHALRQVQA